MRLSPETPESTTTIPLTDVWIRVLQDRYGNRLAVQIFSLLNALKSSDLGEELASRGARSQTRLTSTLKRLLRPIAHPRAFTNYPCNYLRRQSRSLRCIIEVCFGGALLSGSVGGLREFLQSPECNLLLSTFEALDVHPYSHSLVSTKEAFVVYHVRRS